MRVATAVAGLLAGVGLACATAPAPPAPGTAALVGSVRLVPREGVEPGGGGGGGYGDRRLRDVEFVDYSRPGFAVVYRERGPVPEGEVRLAIRSRRGRVRLDPGHAAVGVGGAVVVVNDTGAEHVLSDPRGGLVRRLGPGDALRIGVPEAGPRPLFLLDTPGAEAMVFVSPGPYAVVSESGEFELRDLEPGLARVRAWHPRFPTTRREVELVPGAVARLELEITVAGLEEAGHDAPGH